MQPRELLRGGAPAVAEGQQLVVARVGHERRAKLADLGRLDVVAIDGSVRLPGGQRGAARPDENVNDVIAVLVRESSHAGVRDEIDAPSQQDVALAVELGNRRRKGQSAGEPW